MKKWLLNQNTILKSLGAFALCFVMLFVMGTVCPPASAYAQSASDMIDDSDGMIETSANIADFAKITFTPAIPEGTDYLDPSQTYTIHFDVDETYARSYKMPDGRVVDLLFDTAWMYYELPKGLDYQLTIPSNGQLTLWAIDYQKPQRLPVYATVKIETKNDGTELLTVTWDTDSPGYYLLPISTNAKYELEVQAGVDKSQDVIDLGDGKKYYTDNTARASFTKTINPPELRELLEKEENQELKEDFTFSLTNAYVAKEASEADTANGEVVDTQGFVRDAEGRIVYNGPQDVTVSLADMTWDNSAGHYIYNFPQKLKPTTDSIIVKEKTHPQKMLGYTYNSASVDEATSAEKLTGGSHLTVSLTNVYNEDEAKLKINKAFGADSDINLSNLTNEQKQNIKFTISGTKVNGNAYGPVTYTYAQMVSKNWEIELPAGTYKVTESSAISNYDWTVTYEAGISSGNGLTETINGNAAETGSVKIDADETGVFSFTNTYKQHKGSIRLEKTVVGPELTPDQKSKLTFSVNKKGDQANLLTWTKKGNQYVYDPAGTVQQIPYTDFANGTITLTGLPVGTYEVLESEVNIDGYSRVTNVQVNNDAVKKNFQRSNDVVLGKDETDVVKYTNTYTENASIKVKKTVTGDQQLSVVNEYLKFTLQKKDANNQWVDVEKDISLKNGEINWTGLEFGEYRVVESAERPANFDMSTTVAVTPDNGATVDNDEREAIFTLSASGNSVTTTFTNKYDRKTTDLTINKTLVGAPDGAKDKIKFTVKQDGGATLKWTKVADNEYKYDPNGSVTEIPYGESVKLTGLPAGYTYTVTETTGASGYAGSYIISTTANGASGTSASVELKENNGSVNTGKVDFVNTYKPIAKIAIDKTFTGVLSNEYVNEKVLPKLRFIVSTMGENHQTLYHAADGTWTADKNDAKKFSYTELSTGLELEANKTYYIEELNAEVEGFTVSTWWSLNAGGTPDQVTATNLPNVTVTPGQTPTVNFINDYRVEGIIPGNIRLNTKTWAGLAGSEDEPDSELAIAMKNVRFKLEYKDNGSWKTYDTYTLGELTSGTKTYKNPVGPDTIIPIHLPAGEYRLTEINYVVSGYDHEVFITIVENGKLNYAKTELMENKQVEFTVTQDSTYQFGLANVYTPKGALAVKKVIEGVDEEDREKIITFKLTRKLGVNGEADTNFGMAFSLADFKNGAYTVSDLPTGDYIQDGEQWEFIQYYYIVEETGTSVEHHTWVSTTVKVDNGEAASTQSASVTLEKGTTAPVTVEFTNTYTRSKCTLTVEKTILGNVPKEDADKIKFQLTSNSGEVIKWDVVNGDNVFVDGNTGTKDSFTYRDMVDGKFTIKNLNTGTYRLVESNADIPNFKRTTKFSFTGDENMSGPIKIADKETVTVTVTNTYEPVGKLTVYKTFKFDGAGMANANFAMRKTTFVLKNKNGETVAEFDLQGNPAPEKVNDSANEWIVFRTIENLVPGDYTIEEKNADETGYTVVTTVKVGADGTEVTGTSADFQIAQGENEVSFKNAYTEQGKVSVKKTITGIEGNLTDKQKDSIVFGLYDNNNVLVPAREGDAIASGDYEGWVPYAKMNGGIYTWENLDVNKQYYIKETVIDEDNANTATDSTFYGYIHTQTSWSGAASGSATDNPGEVQTGLFSVNKNGVQVTFTNAYKKVEPLSATKWGENFSSDKVGDLPAWVFYIQVDNVGAASMDNNQMTITDVFDTQDQDWFRLVQADGLAPAITGGENVTLTATDNNDGTATYVLTLQEGAPESQTVTMSYYLQPKDSATFQKMLEDTEHKTSTTKKDGTKQATWTYTNTITYYPLPKEEPVSVSADYFYNTDMITKTVTTTDGSMDVSFKLIINQDALFIGQHERLIVLDKMSDNVEVNMSSFAVEPANQAANVNVSKYTGQEDWDIQIEVPNGVALTITYSATIINPKDSVHVTNTVSMEGVIQEVEGDVVFEGGNSGSMSVGAVSIFKHGDTMTMPLEGAVFSLYQCENRSLETIEPVWQADFTTNQYGIAAIQTWKEYGNAYGDDLALTWDVLYYLVEKSAPEGYEIMDPDDRIYFRIYEEEATRKTDAQGNILENYVKTGTVFEYGNKSYDDEVVLTASKTLNGKALENEQFSFQLLNDEGRVIQTKKNAENGTVIFDALTYTYERFTAEEKTAGKQEYTYTIKEVNENAPGYEYDPAEYLVTVTVSVDEDVNGKITGITATPVYTLDGNTVDGATFTNRYAAEGSVKPEGTKTLANAAKITDEFTFQIKANDALQVSVEAPTNDSGNTVAIPYPTFKYVVDPDGKAGVAYADGVITTTVNKAEDLASSYTYTISEVKGGNASIDYDSTVYTYTVSVSDAGNGTLNVVGTLNSGDKADFTNNYYGALEIQKKVTIGNKEPNGSTLADGTYEFTVYEDETCTIPAKDKSGKEVTASIAITNGESKTVTISGMKPGSYWVKETSQLPAGMTVIANPVNVTVSDDPTAQVLVATITNNLGVADLSLTKTVEGLGDYYSEEHANKTFTFVVEVAGANGEYAAVKAGVDTTVTFENGVATVELKADETITISGLQIGAAYTITETDEPDGYTAGTITNGNGVIVGGVTKAEQVNTYAAEGSANLSVTKQVTGNEFSVGDANFTFVLEDEQGNTIDTKSGANESAVVFETLKYTQPGTYYYTISEVEPKTKIPGMEYNSTVYYAIVTVTDNGDGTLSTAVKYGQDKNGTDVILEIENLYTMVEYAPVIKKVVDGNGAPYEVFQFMLTDGENYTRYAPGSTTVDAHFPLVTYYETGVHVYTITEVAPSGKTQGMAYSEQVITCTVTISEDENGALVASAIYEGGDGDNSDTITNTYEKPTGGADIRVTKAVTGDLDLFDASTKFVFTLAKGSESAASSDTNNVIGSELSQSIAKGGTATWHVDYDQPGTYTYTITETDGGVEGIVYDTAPRTVKVVVTYNEITLQLDAVVTYGESGTDLTVTNQYGETSYQPKVQKALLGNTAPEETYNFVLKGADMADMTASVTGEGSAEFGKITYKTPGTYTYTITETAGSTEGMTYSDATITLTVKVVRAEDGKLSVESATYTVGEEQVDTFTNVYRKVTFQPQVKKLVTGEGAPADATFTFQLKDGDKLVGTEKTIKAGETAIFDEIVKHEAGEYTYTITEVKGNVPGMAYDTAPHTVTVTVREDEETKALSAAIKYDTDKDALEVTNVYTTVKYQPEIVKVLTGDTDKAPEETFSFTLTQTSAPDGVAAHTETRTLEGTGEVAFSEITFALPGTYVFEITENPGTTEGMIYSAEKVVVTVVVTADENNQLSLTADYKGGTGTGYNTITNKYGETSYQLDAVKVLTGDTDRYLEDEDFTFQLLDSDKTVLQTKTCKAGGSIVFDTIAYKTAGTYEYTVKEVHPEDKTPGMTYSEEEIVYTVVVYADDEGKLNAIASPKVGNVSSNVITNVYDRPEGEATIEATKLISGNAYTGDEEFIFTLALKDDVTATNNVVTGEMSQEVVQGGSASWTIAYDTIGTYTYTITETKGDTAGMVYDETEHTVTVKVEYSEDEASLVTTVTYDDEQKDLDITNKYSEISFQPKVIKALADLGRNSLEEVFTFGLTQLQPDGAEYSDEAYALIARAQDDESTLLTNEAVFATLTYNEPGVYEYQIWEEDPTEFGKGTPGMTYSDEIITLTVTVDRDDATGELTLTAVYTGEEGDNDNTITNTYVKPVGTVQIMVNKLVTGNTTQADIDAGLYDPEETFTFTLEKTTQVIVPSDTNDVVVLGEMEQQVLAGKSAVWGLTYDQPGVYTYTVTETKGITDGMEYDETVYHVTVTVDYNSDESGLVATVSYDDAKATTALGEMQVNNKFSAISFQPEIQKTLTGRFLLPETFDFVLTQVATGDVTVSDPAYTEEISIAIDPASTAFQITETKGGKFTELVYHEPGTYQYQIVEVIPEAKDRTPGMTYSKEIITYTVVVVKDEVTGALSIESETYTTTPAEEGAEAFEGNTFTNSYARPEGEAEIFVNKAMTGNAYDGLNKFTFMLSKFDPTAMPGLPDDGETGDGLVPGGDDLIPVDPDDPTGSGDEDGAGAEDEPEAPTVPSIKPPVKPGVDEMEPLVPMETNNLIFPGELQTIGVDETAKWTIKYDMPGTYEYTLQEIPGDEAGVEYDQTIYHVTVVMDYLEDEEGNRMSLVPVSITYTDAEGNVIVEDGYTEPDDEDDPVTGGDDPTGSGDGDATGGEPTEPGEDDSQPGDDNGDGTDPGEGEEPEVVKPGLTITNKYSKIEFVPEVDKIVNGRGAPREYFTFQLTDGQGYWDTARCLDEETAAFTTIVYNEPGTYTYTITELEPEHKTYGMSYSDEIITVTVVVERNDETGELTLNASYTGGGTFENTYNPPPTYDYKFSFTKKWQGGVESSLEWTLYDANGNVVSKRFNKDVISETEWYYEAWFASDKGYYLIEDVPEGYEPIYINVGKYADVTDRLYNGGTIINYTIPATGDGFNAAGWAAAMLLSAAALMIGFLRRKRAQ